MGGARFNPTISEGTITMPAPSKYVEVKVPTEAWGEPASGEYLVTVTLTTIKDAAGKQIMVTEKDEDGVEYSYPYTVSSNYTSPYTSNAKYIGLDPDPDTTTVWDVYNDGWGFVNFLFDGEVSLNQDSGAEITFEITGGREIVIDVDSNQLWADWDFWTGAFAVTVPMEPNSALTESNLKKINVVLYDVVVGGEVSEYEATYELVATPMKSPARNTASSKMTISTETPSCVYDINGNVVMNSSNDIQSLPAGIYIMNGRKFIVR
ncbi:MAG: hypothetical protein K2M69_09040 [Muribaculaceae bacterium]|nr:hypothetical protein [Muribaculaceae bacterium]